MNLLSGKCQSCTGCKMSLLTNSVSFESFTPNSWISFESLRIGPDHTRHSHLHVDYKCRLKLPSFRSVLGPPFQFTACLAQLCHTRQFLHWSPPTRPRQLAWFHLSALLQLFLFYVAVLTAQHKTIPSLFASYDILEVALWLVSPNCSPDPGYHTAASVMLTTLPTEYRSIEICLLAPYAYYT